MRAIQTVETVVRVQAAFCTFLPTENATRSRPMKYNKCRTFNGKPFPISRV